MTFAERIMRDDKTNLSRFMVTWLEVIIEISIWLTLLAALVSGYRLGDGFFSGIFLAAIFGGVAMIFCAIFFGGFIALLDIRNMLKTWAAEREQQRTDSA